MEFIDGKLVKHKRRSRREMENADNSWRPLRDSVHNAGDEWEYSIDRLHLR